jgi:hypothetical protein
MGVNNRGRRAAKRRKQRGGSHAAHDHVAAHRISHRIGQSGPRVDPREEAQHAGDMVREAVFAVRSETSSSRECAMALLHGPVSAVVVAEAMARRLADATATSVRRYWTPADLAEITRRRLTDNHVVLVGALLAAETSRHLTATVTPGWREELARLPTAGPPVLASVDALERALDVAAMLDELPAIVEVMPPPGTLAAGGAGSRSDAPSRLLAKVRALLAKAESTDYPAEAEALSAKAQQLITTYALDRFAAEADAAAPDDSMNVRRLWIESPYVVAKAMLVHEVAGANHCRAVLSEALGFSTLVGHPRDVEATELLVTSLLVQADRAMLGHGRQIDRFGRSRTASFRRSFLLSYAARIGERLRKAADETLSASDRPGELVPLMARADERVRAATDRLFPTTVARPTSIGNSAGWAAGRVAADLALLDVRGAIAEDAAG